MFPAPTGDTDEFNLAERFYLGHLGDLADRLESGDLARFICDLFSADPQLLSDRQKEKLGLFLLKWAAEQPETVRNAVWRAFGTSQWILPVLELLEKLPRPQRLAMLDVHPSVLVEVIEPFLGDRPGHGWGKGRLAPEERMDRRWLGGVQPLV